MDPTGRRVTATPNLVRRMSRATGVSLPRAHAAQGSRLRRCARYTPLPLSQPREPPDPGLEIQFAKQVAVRKLRNKAELLRGNHALHSHFRRARFEIHTLNTHTVAAVVLPKYSY